MYNVLCIRVVESVLTFVHARGVPYDVFVVVLCIGRVMRSHVTQQRTRSQRYQGSLVFTHMSAFECLILLHTHIDKCDERTSSITLLTVYLCMISPSQHRAYLQ